MICGKLEACVKRTIKGQSPDECDNREENCIEFSDTRMHVKCEEKKKKYVLENTMGKHIVCYRMDGGIVHVDAKVPEGVAKCDYLYVIDTDKPTAVLTELKGVDVAKAIQQIDSTLILFSGFFGKCSKVYGRIFAMPFGIAISFKLLHPLKALAPILVTPSGIIIVSRSLHP